MNEYRYCVSNNCVRRLHVEMDTYPCNPRADLDGYIGTMSCFGRYAGYSDEPGYRTLEDLKKDMMQSAGITMETLLQYAQKDAKHIRLIYQREEYLWQLYRKLNDNTEELLLEDQDKEILDDDILEEISLKEIVMLSQGKIIALPLYIYDHSGVTISTVRNSDPWDTSYVGMIWTTLEKVKETGIMPTGEETLESFAKDTLKAEVHMYDQYLTGEVYGYIVETLDENGEWEESDSCYGYYPATNDPLMELADEAFGKGQHTKELAITA